MHEWDVQVDWDVVCKELKRVCKDKAAVLVFCDYKTIFQIQHEFASRGFIYKYFFTWDKVCTYSNAACKNRMPLNAYEYILVFSQKGNINYYHDCDVTESEGGKYNYAVTYRRGKRTGLDIKEVIRSLKAGNVFDGVRFSTKNGSYLGTGYVLHVSMKQVHDNMDDYEIGEDYVKRKKVKHLSNGSRFLLTYKNTDGVKQKLHPTQKPLELMKKLVSLYSKEGDTVLDFCMGSGSTGAACKELKRDFIGIEADEHFYDIAKKRLEEDK